MAKLFVQSPLDGKGKNEVIRSLDAIQVWQEWFAPRYGELKELRHRSNPDDPPDLDLVFERGEVGLEHTALKPCPLGHAEAIAAEVNPHGGRFLPSLSRQWTRDELEELAFPKTRASWANSSDEYRVVFASLVATIRRKIRDPASQIICVWDQATLENTADERQAIHLWQTVNTDEFEHFADRTVILLRRDNPLQFFSALVRRNEPLQARRNDKPLRA